jgi:hypothetical protein
MARPVAVRVGLALLLLALILNATALLMSAGHVSRVEGSPTSSGGAAASLLFYGAFLYAMAQRRNWARLVFAFLFVVGAILSILFTLLNRLVGEGWGPQVASLFLIGAGLVCLFVPSAAAWYHAPE